VQRGLPHFGILAALAVAAALGGCSADVADSGQQWFRKPLHLTGQTGGYTFSDLQEKRQDRPITANDLVEANGSCPAAQAQPVGAAQGAGPTGAPDGASLIDEGVALGMSECDVVHRAGAPSNIEIGKNPNGERAVTLSYQSGPRPGVYRFEGGRLMEMDRVAEAAPPPVTAKKKPAKPVKPKTNSAT
jgi:hypothetical protein